MIKTIDITALEEKKKNLTLWHILCSEITEDVEFSNTGYQIIDP